MEREAREGAGNTLAVYEFFDNKLVWKEQHLYGAERIGTYMVEATLYHATTTTTAQVFELEKFEDNEKTKDGDWVALAHYVGVKRYEITNHLGNVLAVVTDRRMPDPGAQPGSVPGYWQAEVVQIQEYYVFGAKVPNRCWEAGDKYRYGFNGKETSDEVASGDYDFGSRIYSATLGRWMSVDPLAPEYPYYTPYQFAGNMPVWAIDLDGLEPVLKTIPDPTPEVIAKCADIIKSMENNHNFKDIYFYYQACMTSNGGAPQNFWKMAWYYEEWSLSTLEGVNPNLRGPIGEGEAAYAIFEEMSDEENDKHDKYYRNKFEVTGLIWNPNPKSNDLGTYDFGIQMSVWGPSVYTLGTEMLDENGDYGGMLNAEQGFALMPGNAMLLVEVKTNKLNPSEGSIVKNYRKALEQSTNNLEGLAKQGLQGHAIINIFR